jgi:predicted nucleotidyltransferase
MLERNMESIIEKNRQAIVELCRKYHVVRLDVFGSFVAGDFGESSDIDLFVEFDAGINQQRFDNFFELLRSLERLFGRRVDLVESGGLRNPYFIKHVNQTRRPIYAAS